MIVGEGSCTQHWAHVIFGYLQPAPLLILRQSVEDAGEAGGWRQTRLSASRDRPHAMHHPWRKFDAEAEAEVGQLIDRVQPLALAPSC